MDLFPRHCGSSFGILLRKCPRTRVPYFLMIGSNARSPQEESKLAGNELRLRGLVRTVQARLTGWRRGWEAVRDSYEEGGPHVHQRLHRADKPRVRVA